MRGIGFQLVIDLSFGGGFNFRLGTYNVPPGSSAPRLTTSAKHEFDGMGWDGWDGMDEMDGMGRNQKCPSMFFVLCEYIDHVYLYLYRY